MNNVPRPVSFNTILCIPSSAEKYDESLAKFQESLDIRVVALGPDHIDVSSTQYKMSLVLEEKGDIKKALQMCAESVMKAARVMGQDHPEVSLPLSHCLSLACPRLPPRVCVFVCIFVTVLARTCVKMKGVKKVPQHGMDAERSCLANECLDSIVHSFDTLPLSFDTLPVILVTICLKNDNLPVILLTLCLSFTSHSVCVLSSQVVRRKAVRDRLQSSN